MMEFPARYNDGKTAQNQNVRISIEPGRLVIGDELGGRITRWQIAQLEIIDGSAARPPLRLSSSAGDGTPLDARLIIEDRTHCVELLDQLPGLAKRRRVHTPGVGQALLYGAVTALILAILYFGYPRLVEVVTRFVPVTWEEQVGQASAEQIAQVFSRGKDGPQFCGAGPGAAALRRLTGRLVAKTQSPYQWRVRVVPTGKVNAFAAPGGHILILSGLIKQAKSPDEVAGVLAHEIGHVVLRHSTQSLIQQMGITSLFTILFGNQGILPGLGELLIAFSFSREAETEADGFALELLANAGIRAGGLKRFFARLAKKSEKLPDFLTMLSTHPASGQRAQQAKKGPEGDPGMSDRDWADLRKICPG